MFAILTLLSVYTVSIFVHVVVIMAQAASKTCEICTRASGSHYCSDCEQLFCQECKTAHLRSKVSRNHQFLTGPNIQPKPKVGCPDHNEDYIFYCVPCDTPVCKSCMTDSHNRHEVKALAAVVSEIKSDLNNQLQIKIETLQASLSKVKQGTNLLKKDVEGTIQSIQQQGEEVKNAVDKEVQKLVQSVRERSNRELKRLSADEQDLKSFLDEGNKLQNEYQDVSRSKDDTRALEIFRRIMDDCKMIPYTNTISKIPSMNYAKPTIQQKKIEVLVGSVSYETSGVKQYKYKCVICGTVILSEYCPNCG